MPVPSLRGGLRRALHPGPVLATASLLLLLAAPAAAQPGRAAPVPVGPFLNGILPPRTPLVPGTTTWDVVPAFPNLNVTNSLVIVPHPDPAANRLYIGSRAGEIVYVPYLPNDPSVTSGTPFLDLRDRVAVVWDGGFLGLVFHPDFGVPGSPFRKYLYVWYSSACPLDASRTAVDLAACDPNYPTQGTDGYFGVWLRLSRFEVPDGQETADPASERVMINIRLYNGSHRGGGMLFGPDGYMYLSIGDQFRYDTAQDIANTLEGGVVRLAVDVDDHGDGTWTCPAGSHAPIRRFDTADEISGLQYCIPDDNPWPDPTGTTFEEYYSIGHRNPHRMTIDAPTGRIWAGEVGESTREEVNIILPGHNYGWPFREGKVAGPRPEPSSYLGILTDPVVDFTRSEAAAIIGGFVYHGTKFPELVDRYLAGDYVTGNVWAITLDPSETSATAEVIATFTPGGLATWGQGPDGELYMGSVSGATTLFTLDRVGNPVYDPPSLLSQLGVFDDLASLDPAAYWLPYALNQPFWSDGAAKWRWVAVPNDGTHDTPAEQVGWSESSDWTWPVGTVLMKHFELPLDESDPSLTTRLETRLLVHGDDGNWYGLTYRWLADQSDAVLLTSGETGSYTVQTASGPRTETWTFPSRSQCLQCHNAALGGPAGPRNHQLNGDFLYPDTGITDNQLRTWNHLGMFSPPIDEQAIPGMLASRNLEDVTASLEDRSRSWLDANCSNCHRPGTGNRATFDARLTVPLSSQGLVGGAVIDPLGIPGAALIVPGDPLSSIVYQRAAAVGPLAMPPLAKDLAHQAALDRLGAWIARIDPNSLEGVSFEYYEVAGLSVLPDFDSLVPVQTGIRGGFDILPRNVDDDFAFRFRGVVEVPTAGTYTFFTTSDDGSKLLIDGALVVDNDGLHAAVEAQGSLALSAGFHAIEVQFFERGGGESLDVSWQGPGLAKQAIAQTSLHPGVPVPNQAPSVTTPSDLSSLVGQTVSVQIAASDPDADPLDYEASGLPPGLAMDPGSGVIAGTLAPGSAGLYTVVVGVSDGPAVASTSFDWVVSARHGRCGLGFELAAVLPLILGAVRRRRRA